MLRGSDYHRNTPTSSKLSVVVSWTDTLLESTQRIAVYNTGTGSTRNGMRRIIFPSLHQPISVSTHGTLRSKSKTSRCSLDPSSTFEKPLVASMDRLAILSLNRQDQHRRRRQDSHIAAQIVQRYPACVNFSLHNSKTCSSPFATAIVANRNTKTNSTATGTSEVTHERKDSEVRVLSPILRNEAQRHYSGNTAGTGSTGSCIRTAKRDETTEYPCDENASDVSSTTSDVPSLDSSSVSTSSDDGASTSSFIFAESASIGSISMGSNDQRSSLSEVKSKCRVRFQLQDRVREFQHNPSERTQLWYTRQEMQMFKMSAMQRIMEYNLETSVALSHKSVSIADYSGVAGSGTGHVAPPRQSFWSEQPSPQNGNNATFMPKDPAAKSHQKLLFTHIALSPDSLEESATKETSFTSIANGDQMVDFSKCVGPLVRSITCGNLTMAECQIRNILVVDSHDVCLALFAKGLHRMFPQAKVTTARTSDDALGISLRRGFTSKIDFDVVIVEERLKLPTRDPRKPAIFFSGSTLLREMISLQKSSDNTCRPRRRRHGVGCPLYIGVSAHVMEDSAKLKEHGADIVWSKPPPSMDNRLRDAIVDAIRAKR